MTDDGDHRSSDNQEEASSPNQANGSNDNGNTSNFSFKYTESGGLTSCYLLISFESNTNTLSSSTDIRY